jgi:hypothetical protein
MELNSNQNFQEISFPSSKFLDTANRVKMAEPVGTFMFLEAADSIDIGDGYPVIAMEAQQLTIQAATYQTSSEIQLNTVDDLQQLHGIDAISLNTTILIEEAKNKMEQTLFNKYAALGRESYYSDFSKWQRFLNKYFKFEFPIYWKSDQICAKILEISLKIAKKSRRGPANFVVVSPQVFSIIADSPLFEFYEKEDNDRLHLCGVGKINHIQVFVNHLATSHDVVVGMKTLDNNPGVLYGEYSRQLLQNENRKTNTVRLELRDRCVIQEKGNSAKNSYYTVPVEFNKKSIWRKLIKA